MRLESKLPFVLKDGSVGYIHKADGDHRVKPVVVKQERKKPAEDIEGIYYDCINATLHDWQEKLAKQLGVTYSSVKSMGAAWSKNKQAWLFPMRDGHNQIVGIRVRAASGEKWAITGSKNALFIPLDDYYQCRLFVFEGPTDTCAGYTVGVKSIGRPSCSAGLFDIVTFVKANRVKEVVIVADSDKPGLDGAEVLSRHLPVKSVTITMPCKDMREFIGIGGTRAMLNGMVDGMVWTMPVIGVTA